MRFKIISVVFRKELTDIIRDRRALVISVLIPLLLFPVSFFAMNLNLKKAVQSLESGIPSVVNVRDHSISKCIISSGKVVSVKSTDPLYDLSSGKIAVIIDEVLSGDNKNRSVNITSDNTSQYSSSANEVLLNIIKSCNAENSDAAGTGGGISVNSITLLDVKKGSGILLLQGVSLPRVAQ